MVVTVTLEVIGDKVLSLIAKRLKEIDDQIEEAKRKAEQEQIERDERLRAEGRLEVYKVLEARGYEIEDDDKIVDDQHRE